MAAIVSRGLMLNHNQRLRWLLPPGMLEPGLETGLTVDNTDARRYYSLR